SGREGGLGRLGIARRGRDAGLLHERLQGGLDRTVDRATLRAALQILLARLNVGHDWVMGREYTPTESSNSLGSYHARRFAASYSSGVPTSTRRISASSATAFRSKPASRAALRTAVIPNSPGPSWPRTTSERNAISRRESA